MKASWPVKMLGEIATVIAGQSPPGNSYNSVGKGTPFYQGKKDYGVRFLSPPTVWTTEETKIAEANDLLISVRAPVGALNFATQRVCIGRGLAAIRTTKVLPDFLYYALSHLSSTILGKDGVVFSSITKNDIKKIVVPVLPADEQKRIVGILDAAFEKIDAVQRNAERNLANAKELFQRVLDEEMTPKDGNKLFNLKEIAAILVGYAFKSSEYSTDPHDLKLVCGDNIEPGFFRWDETKYWPRKNVAQYSQFLLKTDDVVLAMDRPWIKSGLKRALVKEDVLPALLLQRTACLRTGDKDIARYLYFILGSSFFVEHVLNQQTPGSVPHISGKQIASFPLYLPEEKRIHSAVRRISTLYEATQTEESKYRRLLSLCAELKRQILAKAFNGEL